MSYPKPIKKRIPIDALTGIKSSLSNIRQVVSLIYILFTINGKKSFVDYSVSINDGKIGMRPDLLDAISKLFTDVSFAGSRNLDLTSLIENNPLLKNQFESLYVGITLLFRLGDLRMKGKSSTSERTGGLRFPKQLYFSTNILLLDLILESIPESKRTYFLYEWLTNQKSSNEAIEKRVCSFLSVCTQYTQFKVRDSEGKEIYFQTEGIYEALISGDPAVQIDDSKESVGPTRIYKNIIKEDLEPWIKQDGSKLCLSKDNSVSPEDLYRLISTTLDISTVKTEQEQVPVRKDYGKVVCEISASKELSALRTKPFLLLAGISGTGKSRKVQELAYLTCKRDGIHDTDKSSPGNYLLIPVKPNWHDSTELLGYYSSITGKYVLTDFIRFLWKAWIHRDVPYFLCLDEMNLAPVEQYFAEYLSILETRKLIYNEDKRKYEIQTAELLSKKLFEGLDTYAEVKIEDTGGDDEVRTKNVPLYKGEDIQIINFLKENGLRLPDNLFVIGTVNMDDTTHQFSRKVIDRAFTIEMNGDELSKMFDAEDTLAYQQSPLSIDAIRPRFIKAQEVIEAYPQDAETIKAEVPAMLDKINGEGIFKNTPFRVSYRVQNELILYYAAIRPNGDLQPDAIKGYLGEAFMAILLEKILPRVEGDEKAMHCNEKGDSAILLNIRKYLSESFVPEEGKEGQLYSTLLAKLDEMNERVKNSYFTSFFS